MQLAHFAKWLFGSVFFWVQFGSVFFRIVIAVVVVVQISVLLAAVGPFCEAAVRITILLEEVRIVVAIVAVRASILSDAVGPFCEVAVRINILLNAIRVNILSGRSSSSTSSSGQYSFGASCPILRSSCSDEHSFEGKSGRYSCGP